MRQPDIPLTIVLKARLMFKAMRAEILLSIIAIAMSFVSGVLVLVVQQGPSLNPVAPVLDLELQKFANIHMATAKLPTGLLTETLQAESRLPTYHLIAREQLDRLLEDEQKCTARKLSGPQKKVSRQNSALIKAWQWQDFRCRRADLPSDFFATPPKIHPSGVSYAQLWQGSLAWRQEHWRDFHILELASQKEISLPPPYDLLKEMDWLALAALNREDPLVLSKEWVFSLSEKEVGSYALYRIADWREFWEQTPFQASARNESNSCFVVSGDVCWTYNVEKAYLGERRSLFLLLGLSLLLTVLLGVLLVSRLRQRLRQEDRLQFALQMLTHELRTPLTNLTLNVEELRQYFDTISDSQQDSWLKISAQTERLRRVAETSRFYLAKELKYDLVKLQIAEITDISAFVYHSLEFCWPDIDVKIEGEASLRTDPYWASICLKHLVENALRHGRRPVKIVVTSLGNGWSVQIEDAGHFRFDPLTKGRQSSGLGFG